MTTNGQISPSTASDTITLDQNEAARITRLSAKTLGRLADGGECLGRIKIGRRVLYLRSSLEQWLASKAGTRASSQSATK